MSTTTELAAVGDGFEKAEKQDFGDDTSKIKFFWDSGGEEGGLDIGEVERSRRYHPWRSIAEGQDDVIWMGLEIKDEFCTFKEAWDALGRPEKFLLNSGNGSLFITLNREEPIDAPTISVELQDGQSTETVELPADATEEQIEDAAREWAEGGEWGDQKVLVSVSWTASGREGELTVEAGSDPEPPECSEDQEHDWRKPEWLGGCRENPGVWSLGGARISTREVCCHCGAYRMYESGEDGRTPDRTHYAEADEESLEWVERQNRQ
jgi:hypothetical protein